MPIVVRDNAFDLGAFVDSLEQRVERSGYIDGAVDCRQCTLTLTAEEFNRLVRLAALGAHEVEYIGGSAPARVERAARARAASRGR